jgi:hypothetical protein
MMKTLKFYISILSVIVIFSSCLKDKFNVIDPSNGSAAVVEFKLGIPPMSETSEGALYTGYALAYPSQAAITATYMVNVTGPEPAKQDVVVNIGSKTGAVAAFNADKQLGNPAYAGFTELPANLYTILTPTVTVKAGQRTAEVQVEYKTSSFDFTKRYAFPLSITSATGVNVSRNFGTVLLNVSPKNAWDGIYSMEAGSSVTRYLDPTTPANDALSGSIAGNSDISLASVGANTVEITGLKWAGNASGVAGVDNLRITVDPVTNLCTMQSLGTASLANIAGQDNKYDPVTKTFRLNFDWNQTGTKREMTLVIKYKGSR